jgi:integrase
MNSTITKSGHPSKVLTAVKVRALSAPGRYADGNGLYLLITRSGSKQWVLRTVIKGKRCDIGLGGVRLVSLAEARERAITYRKKARDGGDPLAERRKAAVIFPTFAEAATKVHAQHKSAWKNAKHADQWINTLSEYVFPVLGDRRVDRLDTPDILEVLLPIWLAKPETARRVRQRIGTVLDWAKAAGFRSGDNPVAGVTKGLPNQPKDKRHHAALPYSEIPSFLRKLQASGSSEIASLAFEFLILTATRTNELLGAKWQEIDLKSASWTIPVERMKAKRKHRVPLSSGCLRILERAKQLSADSDFVFAGRLPTTPMSNMVFLMLIRRMGLDITAHGFRSAFADWAAEQTNFSREVCEMALAHTIKNKTEAAYVRGDLFEKRRELMAAWASFVSNAPDRQARIRR